MEEKVKLSENPHVEIIPTQCTRPPPDGGFGWAIALSAMVCNTVHFAAAASFSILYTTYADVFNASAAATGWIGSLQSFSLGCAGLVGGPLADRFGCRQVAVVSSLITSLGILLSSLAPNIYVLYATNGLLTGPGMGLTYLAGASIIQQWFLRKRSLAAGVGMLGMPLGYVVAGPLTTALNNSYGWRGTLLLYSAITLQATIGGCLFRQPPISQWICAEKFFSGIYKPKLCEQESSYDATNIREGDKLRLRSTLRRCSGTEKTSSLTSASFILFLCGTHLMNYGLLVMLMHTPSRAHHHGVPQTIIQLLPTATGVCQFLGTVIGCVIGHLPRVVLPLQFSLAVLSGGVFTALIGFTGSHIHFLATCVCGAATSAGLFMSVQNTVIRELVGVRQVSRAIGIHMMVVAVPMLTAVPFAGWLYDVSGSYDIPYFVHGVIQILGGLLLLVIPLKLHRIVRD